MRFFLDLEAARFTNRVISVGCVTETGDTFYSLVNPNGQKIDKFITELTGITREQLAAAPSADLVFEQLHDFILAHDDQRQPEYWVYGDSDKDFLKSTLQKMNNVKACMCVQAIIGSLQNYAPTVEKFFGLGQSIGLKRAYLVIHKEMEDFKQDHNSLNDAELLRSVFLNLPKVCTVADRARLAEIPSQPKPRPRKKVSYSIWSEWLNLPRNSKFTINTHADAESWSVRATMIDHIMYFRSVEEAALWLIRFSFIRQASPKKEEDIKRIVKNIKKPNSTFCGFCWAVKE